MSLNDKKNKKDLLEGLKKFTPSSRSGKNAKSSDELSDRDQKKASIHRKKQRRKIVYGIFRFIAGVLKVIMILLILGILCVTGLGVGL